MLIGRWGDVTVSVIESELIMSRKMKPTAIVKLTKNRDRCWEVLKDDLYSFCSNGMNRVMWMPESAKTLYVSLYKKRPHRGMNVIPLDLGLEFDCDQEGYDWYNSSYYGPWILFDTYGLVYLNPKLVGSNRSTSYEIDPITARKVLRKFGKKVPTKRQIVATTKKQNGKLQQIKISVWAEFEYEE